MGSPYFWCARRDGVRITECDLPHRRAARLRRLRSFFLFPGKGFPFPGAPLSGFKPSRPGHKKIRQPLTGSPYFWCARRDGVRITECDLPHRKRRGFVGFDHSSFSPGKPPLPRGPLFSASSRVAPDMKNAAAPVGVAAFLVREAGLVPARPE